jgi:hypothetical protein
MKSRVASPGNGVIPGTHSSLDICKHSGLHSLDKNMQSMNSHFGVAPGIKLGRTDTTNDLIQPKA